MNSVPTKLAQASPPRELEYTVLAPLPGTTRNDGKTADLQSYIPGLFNLIIGLAAVIAVAYIIFGGFQYITTDAIQGKEDGRKRITNAIYGLLMIAVSWLILFTINPRLLTFDLNIGAINSPDRFSNSGTITQTTAGANPCAAASPLCNRENYVREDLSSANITFNHNCTPQNCLTQVGGLTESTIDSLKSLKASCNCDIHVTGGSELANRQITSAHVDGRAVDLAANSALSSYLGVSNPVAGRTYDVTINGQTARALYEVEGTQAGGSVSTGVHWHITFPN